MEGIRAGATETEVRATFPDLEESPHKYLTQPGAHPRLHFEIDTDETVCLIHVGALPELTWVESCA